MHSEFKSVSEVIKHADELNKFRTAVEGFDVIGKMEEIFPGISSFVTPKRVDHKTLFIRVENSVMRSELSLNREKMIKKINGFFKKEIITSIRFI
jgi:hypothetical protein